MTTLYQVVPALNAHVNVNDNFTSTSPSGAFGRAAPTTTGLTWGYYGGVIFGNVIADGTLTLTASTTNYVVASKVTGVVSVSTTTTNWNSASYAQLYQVVTGTSTITSFTDYRQAYGGFIGGTLLNPLNEAPQVTLASAATVNIGAAGANTVNISGTTTITAFDTIAAGATRRLIFAGALTLTYNATSLILPTASSITTAAGDIAEFLSLGSGNWQCISYVRASGNALLGSPFTGGTLTAALNEAPSVAIASSATPAIGAAAGNTINLTGTTAVTGFDTIAAGAFRRVIFGGVLTLTHNATSLILPTAANITTAADDVAEFVSLGSGNWKCTSYSRKSGIAMADRNVVNALTNSAGVVNIDCSLGDYFTLALGANVTSITFSNLPASGKAASLMVRVTQDPSTARTVAWPASFRWEGTAPAVSTTLSAVDLLAITSFDQGTKWDGTLSKGRA